MTLYIIARAKRDRHMAKRDGSVAWTLPTHQTTRGARPWHLAHGSAGRPWSAVVGGVRGVPLHPGAPDLTEPTGFLDLFLATGSSAHADESSADL